MKKFTLLLLFITLWSCNKDSKETQTSATAQTVDEPRPETTILEKIASAYGIENWDKVEKVNFSFVVNPGEKESARHWTWNPKSDEITLNAKDNNISYNRSDISDEYINTDRAFINDSFWLLFPFHLVWDDVEYDVEENRSSPINNLTSKKLIVKYPKEGGYTPGDKYEVYLDENFHILEWTYHPKGQEEARLANTFEDLSDFNGIKVNMSHSNPENGFQLNFRNVSFE